MRIAKGETEDFDRYVVAQFLEWDRPKRFLGVPYSFEAVRVEVEQSYVVEADDETGLLVQQAINEQGRPIYTNGKDDIILDNAVMVILLMPQAREAFLMAGFKPKLVTNYLKIKIRRKDGITEHNREALPAKP